MRKPHLLAAVVGSVVLVGLAVSSALTQVPGRPVSGPPLGSQGVALLDINFIFKEQAKFKEARTAVENEQRQVLEKLNGKSQAIRNMEAELRDPQRTSPGSARYNQLDERISTEKAQLQLDVELGSKEFVRKRAEIYYNAYLEIQQEVYDYATRNNIALVLNFNGDRMDRERPETISRRFLSNVIWYSQGVDITEIILHRLNARLGGAQQAARPSGQPSRPGLPRPN